MLFNSLTFLVFFAAVFAVYWAIRGHRWRLGFLLLASWVFYAAWYPSYLLLFLLVTAINYAAGRIVATAREHSEKKARRWVTAVVVLDLANLGVFKYFDFFVESGAAVVRAVTGIEVSAPRADFFLPLGISFYTFQMIAYVVDVSRGHCQVIRNPLKMSLFIAFFAQLIAGPIVRANEFIGQLASRREFKVARFVHGLDLIVVGLFKKVLIADQLAIYVDWVYAAPEEMKAGTLMLAMYAYAIQIYCDFSGYTDIGRGCAACLGYELPQNFRAPYFSVNVTEFWRRWHITLSNWLRDYLYIPLGGNRATSLATYRNLLITMVLGGLWHGASWNFVIWGALHGFALAATRYAHEKAGVRPTDPLVGGLFYRVVSTLVTFHFVCFAWIFFRAPTLETALSFIAGIAEPLSFFSFNTAVFGRMLIVLLVAGVLGLGALHGASRVAWQRGYHRGRAWGVARPFFYGAVIVGVSLMANRGPQQFIYFQF